MKNLRPFYLLAALAVGSAHAQDARILSSGLEEDLEKPRLSDARFGYDHDLYVYDGKAWLNICDPKRGAAHKQSVVQKMADGFIAEYDENNKSIMSTPEEVVAGFKVNAETWMDKTLEIPGEPDVLDKMFADAKAAGQDIENLDVKKRLYAAFSEEANLNNTIHLQTSIGNDRTYCSFSSYLKGRTIESAERGQVWKYPRLSAQEIAAP